MPEMSRSMCRAWILLFGCLLQVLHANSKCHHVVKERSKRKYHLRCSMPHPMYEVKIVRGGQTVIGTCPANQKQCQTFESGFTFRRVGNPKYAVLLTIGQVTRTNTAGKWTCVFVSAVSGAHTNKSCTIEVVDFGNMPCKLTFNKTMNRVIGECHIQKFFSSADHYQCKWHINGEEVDGRSVKFHTKPFIEENRVYKSGTCHLNTAPSLGTSNYTVDIYPGTPKYVGTLEFDSQADQISGQSYQVMAAVGPGKSVCLPWGYVAYNKNVSQDRADGIDRDIRPPSLVAHTIPGCPFSVYQGETYTCECCVSDAGFPPGFLEWDDQNGRRIVRANYGVKTLLLSKTFPKAGSWRFKCSLVWMDLENLTSMTFSVRVKESKPPSRVSFLGKCPKSALKGQIYNCTCFVQETGVPRGHLEWLDNNNKSLKRGQNGMYSLRLSIKLERAGLTKFTCRIVWLGRTDVSSLAVNVTVQDIIPPPRVDLPRDCKRSVFKGDNYTCTCTVQNTGSPPGNLEWVDHDGQRVTRGQDAVTSLIISTTLLEAGSTKFTCRIVWMGLSNVSSAAVTVQVQEPKPPSGALLGKCPRSELKGQVYTCFCYAQNTGAPPGHLEWVDKNNNSLTRGEDGVRSLLLITELEQAGSTKFTCRLVWLGRTDVSSATVNVIVQEPKPPSPVLLRNCPQSELKGQIYTCTCYAQNTGFPPGHLEWLDKNNNSLTRGKDGVTSRRLITKLERAGSTKFTCRVVWMGRTDVSSASLNVIVQDVKPPSAPHLRHCAQSVLKGQIYTCVCLTEYLGNPPGTLMWLDDTDSVKTRAAMWQASLTLRTQIVQPGASSFTCTILWNGRLQVVSSATATVRVKAQSITLFAVNSQSGNVTITYGDRLVFQCDSTYISDEICITKGQFYHDSELVAETNTSRVIYSPQRAAKCEDTARYTCQATNAGEIYRSKVVDLSVLCPPRVDDDSTEHFVVQLNSSPSSRVLHVPFVASPATDLVAKIIRATRTSSSNVPNHPLECCEKFTTNCSAYDPEQQFKAACDVTISNMTSKDAGEYVMIVSNSAGSANVTVKLVGKSQTPREDDGDNVKDLWILLGIILGTLAALFLCTCCWLCARGVHTHKKKHEDRVSLTVSEHTNINDERRSP